MAPALYSNPGGIIASSVILEVLAVLFVFLRFRSRSQNRQKLIASDWLILAALVTGTGLTVMEIYGVSVQAFAYPINIPFSQNPIAERFDKLKRIDLALIVLGTAGVGFVKLSVCMFLWHLFSKVVLRRLLIVWIIIVSLWTTAFILVALLECGSHLSAVWGGPKDYAQYCQAAISGGYAAMATDMLTDLITLIIPIPIIIRLNTDTRTKVLTCLVFMVGSLSVGASIAKSYVYITAARGNYTEDPILLLTGISIWNIVEVQVGIVAACGPTLKHLIAGIMPSGSFTSLLVLLGLSKRSRSGSSTLPSFVRRPEPGSEEQLPSAQRIESEDSLRKGGMDQYSLEFLTDANEHVSHK